MLCAISGEAPQQPVVSRKSGNVFERRLIEQYIRTNGTDPVNGEELTTDDLLDIQQPRLVRPRPPTQTSIPALLATFQNEWDALILETYQLQQQLSETRQELSTALYYNDAAEKVIARLQKERDEARDALSRVSVTSNGAETGQNGGGEAMQVDGGSALPEAVVARIDDTQKQLSSTRRKRPVPDEWATPDQISSFDTTHTETKAAVGGSFLVVDESGEQIILGSKDKNYKIFSTAQNKVISTVKTGAQVTAATWAGERVVVGLSTGAVKVYKDGKEVGQLSKHAGAVRAVALHPCGDLVASVGADQSFVLCDLQDLSVLVQQSTQADVLSASFHPDGHLFATGTTTGSIKLFDAKTLDNVHTFTSSSSPEAAITGISFSENGTWLATISQGSSVVTVWDLRKTAQVKEIDVGGELAGVAWDYTGQYLVAAGKGDLVVQRYDKKAKSWAELLRKEVQSVAVAWGKDARSLLSLGADGRIEVLSA